MIRRAASGPNLLQCASAQQSTIFGPTMEGSLPNFKASSATRMIGFGNAELQMEYRKMTSRFY